MSNAQLYDDDNEGEIYYPDDVQKAFASYENEQDEMFEQMRECMLFMSQEYAMAEMPETFVRSAQESVLNPDASEFRPSWSTSSTSTEKESIIVTSWIPCQAKKQEEQKKDS